jgi:hypothetical protein
MIDLAAEELLRIEEVANQCRTHFSTVFRWILKGIPGPDGRRIRLEAVRIGGKWVTTHSAVQRFAQATTPKFDGDSIPAPRTPTARQRASEKAAKKLEQAGI